MSLTYTFKKTNTDSDKDNGFKWCKTEGRKSGSKRLFHNSMIWQWHKLKSGPWRQIKRANKRTIMEVERSHLFVTKIILYKHIIILFSKEPEDMADNHYLTKEKSRDRSIRSSSV